MSDRVLVEFTKDTDVRSKGDRVLVDAGSAASFEKKGVAARVADKAVEESAKKAAPPVTPPPGVSS